MEISTIKYQFIEEIIQINNPEILLSLKKYLSKLKTKKDKTKEWLEFAGIWDNEEANEISDNIKDCKKVDLNEW